MYHGATVPGFPAHPHHGFETVTILRQGFIDHADSLGATARFGKGDVQWGTAWRGTEISGIAGRLVDAGIDTPLPPPPHSWAAQPEAEVAVGTLKMAPGAGGP